MPYGLSLWLSGKESTCNAGVTGDAGLIPGLGRSPGGGHGSPLQYSCLGNPMDRGAWDAIVHGVTKSQTQLNDLLHRHETYRAHTHVTSSRTCSQEHTLGDLRKLQE